MAEAEARAAEETVCSKEAPDENVSPDKGAETTTVHVCCWGGRGGGGGEEGTMTCRQFVMLLHHNPATATAPGEGECEATNER